MSGVMGLVELTDRLLHKIGFCALVYNFSSWMNSQFKSKFIIHIKTRAGTRFFCAFARALSHSHSALLLSRSRTPGFFALVLSRFWFPPCMNICIWVCICIYVCLCIYIWDTHSHPHTHTSTPTPHPHTPTPSYTHPSYIHSPPPPPPRTCAVM